ncbi:MAG: RluA family pseudouridine synthase [Caldimicrobium sp.]
MEILYEDKYLIAVNKKPGWVVQGSRKEQDSLLVQVKSFLKERDKKEGNVFLAVLHRLDKPVSGVLVFAKRSKTAAKFFKLMQDQRVIKIYLAKVEGEFKEEEDLWEDYIFVKSNLKPALTLFKLLKSNVKESLLLLSPLTGRKHQLRIALAKRGYPIIGDTFYGSKQKVLEGKAVLLHALYLSFSHPHTSELLEIWAPIPNYFQLKALDKWTILEFLNKIKKEKEKQKYVSGQNLD